MLMNSEKTMIVARALYEKGGQVLSYREIRDAVSDYVCRSIMDLAKTGRPVTSDYARDLFPEISDKDIITALVDLEKSHYAFPRTVPRGWEITPEISEYGSETMPPGLTARTMQFYRKMRLAEEFDTIGADKPKKAFN